MGTRRASAGVMLIMGLGRLGAYRTSTIANALPTEVYGWLLVVFGLGLFVTQPWRHKWWARLTAALACALLGGMAVDVGVLGVTALLEAWLALLLAEEALT